MTHSTHTPFGKAASILSWRGIRGGSRVPAPRCSKTSSTPEHGRSATLRLAAATIVGLALVHAPTTGVAAALAKSGSYDITNCYSGTSNVIVHSKAHIAFSYTLTGTSRASEPGGPFDNQSFQCVGVVRIMQGTATGDGICEYVDADGDKFLGRYTRTGNPGGEWTFINGTGKYAGITGGGTSKLLAQFPTVRKGHFQSCERATGTYELK